MVECNHQGRTGLQLKLYLKSGIKMITEDIIDLMI